MDMFSVLSFCITWTSVYAQFDVRPKNTYVLRGEPVMLKCTVTGADSPDVFPGAQTWQEYYTDGTPKSISSDNNIFPNYVEEFEIVTDSKYNLRLLSGLSQLQHGGKYGCQNVFDSNQNTFAEIIVLDSDPVCNFVNPNPEGGQVVLEGDTVQYSCQIQYQGRWAPVQLWTDKDGNDVPSNVGHDNVPGSVLHTSVSFNASATHNGQEFRCQTKFVELTPNSLGDNEDATIPSYDNVTAFQTLIVHYSPRDTQITSMNGNPVLDSSKLYPGEGIICITTSNPTVNEITWQNSVTGSTIADNNTDVLVIQEEWLGTTGVRCVVRNQMGEDSTEILITVTSNSGSEMSSSAVAVAALLSTIVVVKSITISSTF